VGADRPPLRFFTIFCPSLHTTGEISVPTHLGDLATGIDAGEIDGPGWLATGIDVGEIDGPWWSVSHRGTAGGL
jgi:hypothetical protein